MARILVFGWFVLLAAAASAQDGAMKGIDAYFTEDGFYDNLEDALSNEETALYLDLSLRSPKLTKVPDDVFKLTNLKYLELGYNQMGAIDDRIVELVHLEVLGLNGNRYLKSVSAKLAELPNLKELHVKDTGLTSEQVKSLRSALGAKCTVEQ
jgi:Leucine-rich repeat (LRR) protein